jgi:hypothetical protein
MRFDIVTIFPGFFSGPLDYGTSAISRTTGTTPSMTGRLAAAKVW